MNKAAIIKKENSNVAKDAIAAQFLVFLSEMKIGVKYRVNTKRLQNEAIPLIRIIIAMFVEIIVEIAVAIAKEQNVKLNDIINRGEKHSREYKINVPSLKSGILALVLIVSMNN